MSLTQRELATRPSTGTSSRTEVIAVDERTEILFKDEVVRENDRLKEQLTEQRALVKISESKIESLEAEVQSKNANFELLQFKI